MSKQIYVNIAWILFCILLWFSLAVAILYFTKTINKIDKIYSKFENPVSCDLPYGIQDKIEWIYNNLDTERVNREIEVKCQ